MAAVVGSLLVKLVADSGPLGTALRAAGVDVTRFEGRTNQALGRVDRSFATTFSKVGGLARTAFAGIAAGAAASLAPVLGLGAALATARAGLEQYDRIAKQAKASGLDSDLFQELAYQAELGGLSMDELAKATETFTKAAGLAAEGKGRMASQLKVLNPELLAAIQNTTSQEERLRAVADALDRETDASRKAAIATAVFGDAGARMVEVLKGGSASLDETARKARELGLVIDRDMLGRAEAMSDQLSTAQRVIDNEFKKALIDLAPVLVASAQLLGDVATAVRQVVDAFKALEQRTTAGLEERMRQLGLERVEIENDILRLQGEQGRMAGTNAAIFAADIADRKRQLAAIAGEEAKILGILEARKPLQVEVSGATEIDPPGFGGGGGGNAAADAALKQAEAVRQLVADLEFERQQLGRTSEAQELYNLLKRAGVDLESEYGQAIAGALGSLQAQRAEIARNQAAMEQFESTTSDAVTTLIDGLLAGKSAAEILGSVLSDLGRQLISMGVSGLSKSLTTSIFPGFDEGGFTGAGARLQPAGVVHKGEYVFSAPSVRRIGVGNLERLHRGFANGGFVGAPALPATPDLAPYVGEADPAISIVYSPSIDARGADEAAVARLERAMAREKAELPAQILKVMKGTRTGKYRA